MAKCLFMMAPMMTIEGFPWAAERSAKALQVGLKSLADMVGCDAGVGGELAVGGEIFLVRKFRDDWSIPDFSDTNAAGDFPSRKPRSALGPCGIFCAYVQND